MILTSLKSSQSSCCCFAILSCIGAMETLHIYHWFCILERLSLKRHTFAERPFLDLPQGYPGIHSPALILHVGDRNGQGSCAVLFVLGTYRADGLCRC